MIYKKLKKLGASKSWHRTKQSIFGLHEGFCFNIIQSSLASSPQFKNIHVRTQELSEDQQHALLEKLKDHKSRKTYQEYHVDQQSILITIYEPFLGVKNERLVKMMDWLVHQLQSVDARRLVEKEDNQEHIYYDVSGQGIVVKAAETKVFEEKWMEDYNKEEAERSSYWNGSIGALLFTVPVIILWVLLAIYLGILSSGLGLIMAFAAYFGYERLKGKRGRLTKWILAFILMLAILLANFFTLYFELSGYGMSMEEMIGQLMNEGEIRKAFVADFGVSVILGVVGWLWIIFGVQTEKPYLKKAEKL